MRARPDILAVLPPDERAALIRRTVTAIMGPTMGEQIWKQMEPVLQSKARQPGDAPEPEQNHWKGVWRIYEAD